LLDFNGESEVCESEVSGVDSVDVGVGLGADVGVGLGADVGVTLPLKSQHCSLLPQ